MAKKKEETPQKKAYPVSEEILEVQSEEQVPYQRTENKDYVFLQKEKFSIRRNFSDKEYKELAEEVARDIARVETLKEEAKSCASDFKTQINNLTNMIKNNSAKISRGFEMEPLTAHVYLDYRNKKRVFINPTNQDILKKIDFRMEDFQRKIALESENAENAISANAISQNINSNLGAELASLFDTSQVNQDFDMNEMPTE